MPLGGVLLDPLEVLHHVVFLARRLPDFICCRCMYQIVYFHAENERLSSRFVSTLATVPSENKYSKWVALVPPTSQSSYSLSHRSVLAFGLSLAELA
jgi:hypothetical protein